MTKLTLEERAAIAEAKAAARTERLRKETPAEQEAARKAALAKKRPTPRETELGTSFVGADPDDLADEIAAVMKRHRLTTRRAFRADFFRLYEEAKAVIKADCEDDDYRGAWASLWNAVFDLLPHERQPYYAALSRFAENVRPFRYALALSDAQEYLSAPLRAEYAAVRKLVSGAIAQDGLDSPVLRDFFALGLGPELVPGMLDPLSIALIKSNMQAPFHKQSKSQMRTLMNRFLTARVVVRKRDFAGMNPGRLSFRHGKLGDVMPTLAECKAAATYLSDLAMVTTNTELPEKLYADMALATTAAIPGKRVRNVVIVSYLVYGNPFCYVPPKQIAGSVLPIVKAFCNTLENMRLIK